jgi:hypothetical protein
MKPVNHFAPAVALTASIILTLNSGSARAITVLPAPVFGTGENLSLGDRDNRWKVVAGPTGFMPPDGQSFPYASYVVADAVPALTINGTTFNPISLNQDSDPQAITGNWIFAQTFTIADPGAYSFDFLDSADNGLTLFANGSIDFTDEFFPTISGGNQLGEAPGFDTFYSIAGNANLPSGENTLYAVLFDFGVTTSFTIANNTNTTEVPGPLPIFGAAAAFGASRRLKRRIRLARSVAPEQST